MSTRRHHCDQVVQGHIGIDRDDIGAGHHYVIDRAITKRQDVVHQDPLVFVETLSTVW